MAQDLTMLGSDSCPAVARAGGERGIWSRLLRRLTNWHRRRQIGEIALLDDYLLEDIGLTRGDVLRAGSMPLDHDPVAALKSAAAFNRVQQKRKDGPRAEVALNLAALRAGQR